MRHFEFSLLLALFNRLFSRDHLDIDHWTMPVGSGSEPPPSADPAARSEEDSRPSADSAARSEMESGASVEAESRPSATFRLPAYSPEEPDLWLVQVQYAFDVANIRDQVMKFKLLVANLPVHVASQVRDVVTAAPSYANLVAALRARLAQSRASRLEALLRDQQLGDQKPTQLLRNMRHSLGTTSDDTGLLRTLFLQRLPQTTRAALALLPEATLLDDLAAAADRFHDASRGATVAQASAPAEASSRDDLAAAVAALTATVARLETNLQRQPQRTGRWRSRSRPRPDTPRSVSPGPEARQGQLCWYHFRFGADARKCQQPCSWQEN